MPKTSLLIRWKIVLTGYRTKMYYWGDDPNLSFAKVKQDHGMADDSRRQKPMSAAGVRSAEQCVNKTGKRVPPLETG